MNNQVDLDINIDEEMETIPTTSSSFSYIIPNITITDNVTAIDDL